MIKDSKLSTPKQENKNDKKETKGLKLLKKFSQYIRDHRKPNIMLMNRVLPKSEWKYN